MNRVFKTKWSTAHQQYVVTDEHHAAKGKASKSAVALAVAALMMAAGSASAAYMESGFVAQAGTEAAVNAAVASWQTDEYKKDWGLEAMHASKAYALGFHGQDTKVAVMDSGALLQKHPDLTGSRFTATHVTGAYGSSGNRYPQSVSDTSKGQPYEKGEKFDVTGNWIEGVNDSHGTHVTGTVGGNRDGNQFHGVAWGADIVVGNTGATDDNNYGPFQDHDFFYKGWKALADDLIAYNGKERGGVINNSWGTNARFYVLQVSSENKDGTIKWTTVKDSNKKIVLRKPNDTLDGKQTDPTKAGSYRWGLDSVTNNTVQDSEYEFFYSNKLYAEKFKAGATSSASFVDAAWEAVKDTNVVQIFTTGNRDMDNPYYRPLYPYFNPEAEKNWIAVAGLQRNYEWVWSNEENDWVLDYPKDKNGNNLLNYIDYFNEAGIGKWWTVSSPGDDIYSSTVDGKGNAGYASWSGTSMAAPHVAGAMGVLMSRYKDMTAIQARDVMFTTANHRNSDGTLMKGWTAAEGTPDVQYGWGVPDLDKGMYGPGQFLGKFDYNMATTKLDVWTNNITNTALDAREKEDKAWLDAAAANLAKDDYVLGDQFVIADGTASTKDHIVDKADAKKWRAEYYAKRTAAINSKIANHEYAGSLIKSGAGTLVMTGENSYKGDTTVKGGTLLAFAESIGNDKVTVEKGGTFGVLDSYNDKFTMTGHHDSKEALSKKLAINVKDGGSLYIDAASNVEVASVTFDGAKKIVVGMEGADAEDLLAAYNGARATVAGKFTAVNSASAFDGLTAANFASQSLFFEYDTSTAAGNTISVKMKKKDGVTFESFAKNANQTRIATAIAASANDLTAELLAASSAEGVTSVYSALDDDFYATARNGLVMNTTAVSRAVMDQARGMGEGRSAELDNGRARIWAAGIGHWGEADGNNDTVDVDFRAGFIGAEAVVVDNTKALFNHLGDPERTFC